MWRWENQRRLCSLNLRLTNTVALLDSLVLSAVADDDEDRPGTAKPGDSSSLPRTPVAPSPGKRTLKNIKTMFYVGTEVTPSLRAE